MDIFTLWTQSLNLCLKGYCKQVGKQCTQRISCPSLSSLVGSRPHRVQRLVSLIFQMRPRARVGLQTPSGRGVAQPEGITFGWSPSGSGEAQPEGIIFWWPWSLEWYCVMWQAAARRPLGCASQAIRSAKCHGNFFTVFHMQRGKEEGEKKPHAALRQGRRQTGPPSSGCACQGSIASDVSLCSPFGGLLSASNRRYLFIFCTYSSGENEINKGVNK